ncbi:MAG: NAD(+) diphosphatase [Rubrivivax sp.]|nr:NAD(+) diphosphatase [Rubrivivax sp.]MCL4698671.1 NAD(+) diphosphatase [Burkholderiaceae bacterium]
MLFVPAVQPPVTTSAAAWCFAFVEGQLLLPADEAARFAPQPWPAIEPWLGRSERRHYLGLLEGVDCWALALAELPTGWRRVPLRAAMLQFGEPLMALAGRAAQVLEWDRAHRHCGVCGTPTELQPAERARRCPACGHTAYPRISPAMMVLVWREGEVLLARSPHYAPGVYSALAGFVEAGESLEECVHREVAEEVGVRVRELRYFGSQSWPFPHSLMVAYTARWAEGDIVPQAGEIEDARWYPLGALPKIPPRFSISGHLIGDTVRWLGGPEPGATASVVQR